MTTTNIDDFLAKQKRYKCDRLNAMLVQEHCDHNKKSGKIISCTDCPGLNAGEDKTMSKAIRGTCPICNREDVLLTSKNGECHRCYKRKAEGVDPLATDRRMPSSPAKKEKPAKKPVQRQVEKAVGKIADDDKDLEPATGIPVTEQLQTVTTQAADTSTEPGLPATDHEIHLVNLIEVFKAKQAEELATFCGELSKRQDPYDKLKFAFEVCRAA